MLLGLVFNYSLLIQYVYTSVWICVDINVSIVIIIIPQDLLQLQYEGVAVMKMFNKAKINVNLLIFLINRKFYGKQILK